MARKRSAGKSSNRTNRRSAQNGITTPTKNTSGSGFGFETSVVAVSLLDLLTEQPLHGVAASRPVMVSVQKGPAHWCCDDLLLTYVTISADQILIPTSIKSFPALSMPTKHKAFVTDAWNDALGENRRPRPLRLGHDRIGLFSSRHSIKLAHTLGELIKKAREQGADFRHNVTSPGHLAEGGKWLSHLSCPVEVAAGISEAVHQSLVASLELREFDFGSPTSQSHQQALNDSRLATVSESHEDGWLLWQDLCGVAEKLREAAGDITRRRLIDKLAAAPKLKDSPRFADTWRRLAGESDQELATSLTGS